MTTGDRDGSNAATVHDGFYAPHPTRATVFMRTFLPWQAWRFVVINMKMLRMIARSHRSR